MLDTMFYDNVGARASAIYSDNSELKLLGSDDRVNFFNNISPLGSTIFATFSDIEVNNQEFTKNQGFQGGTFQIDSTTVLTDANSIYKKNKAEQGGVVFAINDSQFLFKNSVFMQNFGDDGAVLYGMYNSYTRALSFVNCEFTLNYSNQNLMQLMSS